MSKRKDLEKEWTHRGLKCAVIFVRGTHRCGYVGVPKGHIAYQTSFEDLDIHIHGGLTYGAMGDNNPLDKGLYWLGFDCAHYGDKILGLESTEDEHFWTLEEVIQETNDLANQLQSLTEVRVLPYRIRDFLENKSEVELVSLKRQLDRGIKYE